MVQALTAPARYAPLALLLRSAWNMPSLNISITVCGADALNANDVELQSVAALK